MATILNFSIFKSVLIFCTIILACGLFIEEVYKYQVEKPTSVDKATIDMKFKFAPEIFFCPQPAFKQEDLNKMGYNGLFLNCFNITQNIYICH